MKDLIKQKKIIFIQEIKIIISFNMKNSAYLKFEKYLSRSI
ncbi:hypothetical protein EW15_0323 [Prochlorococcus sp. MIT 0801]|nr:hypothetical protein EW15_0323 [Prochlorococcus sp. MIT 0801]